MPIHRTSGNGGAGAAHRAGCPAPPRSPIEHRLLSACRNTILRSAGQDAGGPAGTRLELLSARHATLHAPPALQSRSKGCRDAGSPGLHQAGQHPSPLGLRDAAGSRRHEQLRSRADGKAAEPAGPGAGLDGTGTADRKRMSVLRALRDVVGFSPIQAPGTEWKEPPTQHLVEELVAALPKTLACALELRTPPRLLAGSRQRTF